MLGDLYKSRGPNHFLVRSTTHYTEDKESDSSDLSFFLSIDLWGSSSILFFFCYFVFLPVATYVKVYLLNNGAYVAKKKTKIARKTLDPLYQQALLFEESPHGKVLQVSPFYYLMSNHFKIKIYKRMPSKIYIKRFLQVIVWGDYGRMDHKSFMGVAQILLEELNLSRIVIGWYKLFPPSSLVDPTLASLTRRASQSSLDSSSGPVGVRS